MKPAGGSHPAAKVMITAGLIIAAALVLVALVTGFAGGGRDDSSGQCDFMVLTGVPSPPRGEELDGPRGATASAAPSSPSEVAGPVDVLVYGSTSGGLGAIRGLKLACERTGTGPLTVVLLSPAPGLESPLAQGLSVEDDYRPGVVGGFYGEFRHEVIRHYEREGVWPLLRNGRLVYEPEVADRVLRRLVLEDGSPPEWSQAGVRVIWLRGLVRKATDTGELIQVRVEHMDGTYLDLEARFAVDASVEADLARLLGADYRMGKSSHLYNDVEGRQPEPPTKDDSFSTAPQSLAMLLTLSVKEKPAPPIHSLPEWNESAVPGGLHETLPEFIRRSFPGSWSLRHPLPQDKRELNEGWNDWANPHISFAWYMNPGERLELVGQLQARALHYLALIQGHFPEVGLATLPSWPYVRGEVMVMGRHVYHVDELVEGVDEPIAKGKYARFDRHDPFEGTQQSPESAIVEVPLDATRPAGLPRLLVTTALSVDYLTYNSACRMEPVRANVGAACGVQLALALRDGVAPHEVPYPGIREELLRQGHRHLQ